MHEWTPDEANAALAEVSERVERVITLLDQARREEHPEPDSDRPPAATNGRRHLAPAEDAARTALIGLEAEGVVLHDPDRGLVDLHAVTPSGRPYWLCWSLDEPAIAWWHWPENEPGAGVGVRTPLSEPPD